MSPLKVDRCVTFTLFARSVVVAALLVAAPVTLNAQVASNKTVDDLMMQAQTALTRGKPDEAISILRRAIDMAPDTRPGGAGDDW